MLGIGPKSLLGFKQLPLGLPLQKLLYLPLIFSRMQGASGIYQAATWCQEFCALLEHLAL
jgi:hypothetical protein